MSEAEREEDKDLAKKPIQKWRERAKKEEPKLCPLLLRFMVQQGVMKIEAHHCLGEKCALYVEGHKETIHPDYYLTYHGCGLISNVFWERQKKPLG